MLRFERKCEERRQAGLPFQLTLGSRVSIAHPNAGLSSDSPRTSLRVLYESRKSHASLEFKSAKWREQRSFLRIYVRCAPWPLLTLDSLSLTSLLLVP
jgi:hypothetical protein